MSVPTAGGLTVKTLIDHYAAQTPAHLFFISPNGKTVNFRQLAAAMPAVATLADNMQIPPSRPLAFMMGNGWTAVQVVLGALYSERVVLPLNIAAGDAQIAYVLKQSRCAGIIVDEENEKRLRAIVAAADNIDIPIEVVNANNGITPPAAAAPPAASSAPHALLMYTSGTTGMPKGVIHTQKSLLAGGRNVVEAHQLTAADRAMCVLPLYHINGLCVTVFAPLLAGGSVVMPPRFSTDAFWRHIADTQCTWFSAVPTLISYLLQAKNPPPPLPQLRFGRSASAPLSPALHKAFEQRFGLSIIETMGLTETAAQILSNPPAAARHKIGSPGIAYGNEVRIINQSGNPCAVHETGELVVRGDNVMGGYYDNPDETKAAFTADGWLLTGDLGHQDEEGYFYITGRRKELIIKGGENIAPREIDEALMQLPAVVDAAAFACACEHYGQRVEACVTLKEDAALDEAKMIAHCHSIIGRFKSPDRIYVVADMPRGPSGKVQRLKLADMMQNSD